MTDFSLLSFSDLLAVDLASLSPEDYQSWLQAYSDTPPGFVEEVLGLPLYGWQDDSLAPLGDLLDERGQMRRVKVSVVAPNGSGKSSAIVAGAILYWLNAHKRARVVVTSCVGRQISDQIWPALTEHRTKFPDDLGWHWVTSPVHRITSPTGGRAILYTTNDAGGVEGAHPDFNPWEGMFDGPLLILVDEAKSVSREIYEALDRCTYNVQMLLSSPGRKEGVFYESQTENKDRFVCVKAGLLDCPHIPQSKIEDIEATYATKNPQYLRSVLHGDFMDAEEEQVFDREGLAHIESLVLSGPRAIDCRIDPVQGGMSGKVQQVTLVLNASAESRWFRTWEQKPIGGCKYLIVCDSAKGRKEHVTGRIPDNQSVLVLRDAYIDRFTCQHKPAVVARIIPPCDWRLERIAPLVQYMSLYYGNCTVCVEENNTGLALIALLKLLGVPLYRRREGTPQAPKYEDGHFTHATIRPKLIALLADAIYNQDWDIWCPHILGEMRTFVKKADGKEEAEGTLKDDDILALSIGRECLPSGTVYREGLSDPVQYRQRTRLPAGS